MVDALTGQIGPDGGAGPQHHCLQRVQDAPIYVPDAVQHVVGHILQRQAVRVVRILPATPAVAVGHGVATVEAFGGVRDWRSAA